MTTQIIIFHDNDNDCQVSAYDAVDLRVQAWLNEHPEVVYVNSHSTAITGENGNYGGKWTEFSLTLVVNVPDVAPPTQSEHAWAEIYAMLKTHPAIHMQDNPNNTPSWVVRCPDANFSGTAHSLEWLFDLVKEACDILDLPNDSF